MLTTAKMVGVYLEIGKNGLATRLEAPLCKHGIILPQHRLSLALWQADSGIRWLGTAAKPQGNIVQRLHKFSIHQHIDASQQRIGDLQTAAAGFFSHQLLKVYPE